MFSALLGTSLPGEGSIYLGQDRQFHAPVYPGDTVDAEVEVVDVTPHRRGHLIRLATKAVVHHSAEAPKVAIDGEARVLMPRA
jgi:3-hydroxybutyryl-CoA dehydratase